MSGDGAGTLFIIDEKTGDIHATRRIDREEKAFYTLRAQAINRRTLRPVEPESEFVIKIHDINDNEPTFPEEIYTASVPEMSVVGEFSILDTNTFSSLLEKLFPHLFKSQSCRILPDELRILHFDIFVQILKWHSEPCFYYLRSISTWNIQIIGI